MGNTISEEQRYVDRCIVDSEPNCIRIGLQWSHLDTIPGVQGLVLDIRDSETTYNYTDAQLEVLLGQIRDAVNASTINEIRIQYLAHDGAVNGQLLRVLESVQELGILTELGLDIDEQLHTPLPAIIRESSSLRSLKWNCEHSVDSKISANLSTAFAAAKL